MELDSKTKVLVQLSAAIASNALVKIRETFNEALESGITQAEIQETITLSLQVQQQPISHSENLIHQLMRESKKNDTVKNIHHHATGSSCGCGCGCHHKDS